MSRSVWNRIACCLLAFAWALSATGAARADEPSVARKLWNRLRGRKTEATTPRVENPAQEIKLAAGPSELHDAVPAGPSTVTTWKTARSVSRSQSAAQPASPVPRTIRLASLDGGPSLTNQAQTNADAEIERFVNLAVANNPTLAQATAVVQAAVGREIQAGRYPNPVLGYAGSEIGNDGRAGQQGITLSQEIVRGGKLLLARAAAGHEVARAEAEAAAQVLRVTNAVRSLFFELLAAQQTLDAVEASPEERAVLKLARKTIELEDDSLRTALDELAKAEESLHGTRSLTYLTERSVISAKLRLKGKEGTLADVLQAEIELQQVVVLATTVRNNRTAAWQRLAAAVGLPNLELTKLSGSLELTDAERERLHTLDDIVRASPELKSAEAGIRRADAAVARARAEPKPNVTIEAGTQYDYSSRDQIANLAISFPLPIFNRNDGNIIAAESELIRSQRELDRVKLSLADRFAAAHARYRNALEQVKLYGTRLPDGEVQRIIDLGGAERQRALDEHPQILPRAQIALALATIGWRGGQFSYVQVLTAQRTVTQASLNYIRALADLRQSLVALEGYLLTDNAAEVPATTGGRFGPARGPDE